MNAVPCAASEAKERSCRQWCGTANTCCMTFLLNIWLSHPLMLQDAQKFEIRADIPGVNKRAIKLAVDGAVLSISVHRPEEAAQQVRA